MNKPVARERALYIGEVMVTGKQAAQALCLPCSWFSEASIRNKHRIPHYQLGALVRYRLSELSLWAARADAPKLRTGELPTTDEGTP